MTRVQLLSRGRDFSLNHHIETGSWATQPCIEWVRGSPSLELKQSLVKPNTVHLVLRLVCSASPPLSNVSSCLHGRHHSIIDGN